MPLAALSRVASGPCAVGEPGHARRSPCARTGRSHDHPSGGWAGREGNAEAVSPRCTIVGSQTVPYYLRSRRTTPPRWPRRWWREGDRPRGTRPANHAPGRRAGVSVSSELERVRRVARNDKDARFTALLHHVTVERLEAAYRAIRPSAAPGVDGVMWRDYGLDLEANLRDLHSTVHRGAYRARPSRRAYIPKPDGRLRPLGVAALEDKIVQRAVVEVLNAIYGKRRTTGMRKGMRGSYIEVLATHGGPEPCVGDPRGRSEALDRGARRPAIEPRNAFGRGADAIVDDGRQHRWRRFRESSADPAGSENPLHACDLFMLRTGRSHDHPPVVMARAGRAGKAEAVIP